MTHANLPAVTIGNVTIQQHNGLYSLNDLHKASGGEAKHQPALFVRLDTTQALIAELSSTDSQSLKTVLGKGKAQGTYACRELVIAYASWISAAFQLKVIRVFLDAVAPVPALSTDSLDVDQQRALRELMSGKVAHIPTNQPDRRSQTLRDIRDRMIRYFNVPSIPELPRHRFGEAFAYLTAVAPAPQSLPVPQPVAPAYAQDIILAIAHLGDAGSRLDLAEEMAVERGRTTEARALAFLLEDAKAQVDRVIDTLLKHSDALARQAK